MHHVTPSCFIFLIYDNYTQIKKERKKKKTKIHLMDDLAHDCWLTARSARKDAYVVRYIRCILSGDEHDCTVSRDPEGGTQVEGCEVKAIRRSKSNRSVVQEAWWMQARSGSRKSRRSWNARRFVAVSRGPSSRPAVSRVASFAAHRWWHT